MGPPTKMSDSGKPAARNRAATISTTGVVDPVLYPDRISIISLYISRASCRSASGGTAAIAVPTASVHNTRGSAESWHMRGLYHAETLKPERVQTVCYYDNRARKGAVFRHVEGHRRTLGRPY